MNPNGKTAQLCRLKANDVNLLTPQTLANYSFGKFFRYERIAKGATQEDLTEVYEYDLSMIYLLEADKFTPSRQVQDKFIEWMEIEPESATAEMIYHMAEHPDEPISYRLIDRVLEEGDILVTSDIPKSQRKQIFPKPEPPKSV